MKIELNNQSKGIRSIAKRQENRNCADCNRKGAIYVNLTIGTFVCEHCAGLLRGFNYRVKSVSLSTFTPEELQLLEQNGNDFANKMYLATFQGTFQPNNRDDADEMRELLKLKYIEQCWYKSKTKKQRRKTFPDPAEAKTNQGKLSKKSISNTKDKQQNAEIRRKIISRRRATTIDSLSTSPPAPKGWETFNSSSNSVESDISSPTGGDFSSTILQPLNQSTVENKICSTIENPVKNLSGYTQAVQALDVHCNSVMQSEPATVLPVNMNPMEQSDCSSRATFCFKQPSFTQGNLPVQTSMHVPSNVQRCGVAQSVTSQYPIAPPTNDPFENIAIQVPKEKHPADPNYCMPVNLMTQQQRMMQQQQFHNAMQYQQQMLAQQRFNHAMHCNQQFPQQQNNFHLQFLR